MLIISKLNTLFGLPFEDEGLERKYREDYLKDAIPQNVAAAKIAVVIYLIYAPITYFLVGNEALLLLYVVLFATSGPLFLIAVYKTQFFLKYQKISLYLAALIAGLGPVMFYLFTQNNREIFQVDVLIPLIGIFTMFGIGFSFALVTVLSILGLFLLLSFILSLPVLDIFMALYTMVIGGVVSGIAGYLIEKSKRQLFVSRLQNEEFKDIIDNSTDFIAIYDQKTFKYLYANEAILQKNNMSFEEIKEKTFMQVHPEVDRDRVEKLIENLTMNHEISDIIELKDSNNEVYYVHMILQIGVFNSKAVFINMSSEVTEFKKAELQIKEMAQKDQLTKLYNRYKLDEFTQQQIHNFKRYKTIFSFIICDIDYFKKVNDKYGHLMGDKVLANIAELISQNTRESDLVARWGGEEFAILLPNTSGEEALKVAKKIHSVIENTIHEGIGNIYISCGVSEFREDDTQKSLFLRVDKALYEAKECGRNQVVYK